MRVAPNGCGAASSARRWRTCRTVGGSGDSRSLGGSAPREARTRKRRAVRASGRACRTRGGRTRLGVAGPAPSSARTVSSHRRALSRRRSCVAQRSASSKRTGTGRSVPTYRRVTRRNAVSPAGHSHLASCVVLCSVAACQSGRCVKNPRTLQRAESDTEPQSSALLLCRARGLSPPSRAPTPPRTKLVRSGVGPKRSVCAPCAHLVTATSSTDVPLLLSSSSIPPATSSTDAPSPSGVTGLHVTGHRAQPRAC